MGISIESGGGLPVYCGYQDRMPFARGGDSPLYPAMWDKPGTSITYKRRAGRIKSKKTLATIDNSITAAEWNVNVPFR